MAWRLTAARLVAFVFIALGVMQARDAQAQGLRLSDILHKSDHCFDDFISPTTNPVWFEDPRTLTEVRALAVNHDLADAAAGGDVQLYAAQIRLALTDRLSLVAAKDGYMVSNNPLIDDGWMDVAAGLKYNLYRDTYNGQLLSAGFAYSMPVGSSRTLQGNTFLNKNKLDGELQLYLTGGTRVGDFGHWLSAYGVLLPLDSTQQSTMGYWSNHFDVQMTDTIYALTEFNWYHWFDSGNGPLNGLNGLDVLTSVQPVLTETTW